MIRLERNELSAFKLRRGNGNGHGVAADVDPAVRDHLKELNQLLGKAVFTPASFVVAPAAPAGPRVRGKARRRGAAPGDGLSPAGRKVKDFLDRELTAKFAPAKKGEKWADESVASFLAGEDEDDDNFTLSGFIDKTPALVQLKYAFLDEIQEDWGQVSAGARAVLRDYPNIRDYLIAWAYLGVGISDVDAVKNVILTEKGGVTRVLGYATVGAARALIDREQLRVKDYNDDDSPFVKKHQQTPVPLATATFARSTRTLIDQFRFDSDEAAIIEDAIASGEIGDIDDSIKPTLIKYMQASPVTITKKNAENYLPNFILQIMGMKSVAAADGQGAETTDGDFSVRFQDDARSEFEVSGPAVESAAQLFHAMVLGEELDVFGAVGYLTNRRLVANGGMKIKNPTLRRDLQAWVFDNEFVDTQTKERMTRTRAAERQMFFRQVFNWGQGPVPEDLAVNYEFPQLWNVLILESARYLKEARDSLHPENFMSAQGVAQAVEDLQYNLSTHCTGMATVLSPIVDAELAFVLDRVLKHPEVILQIVPEGGTWKRAMDKLNIERKVRRPNATTLYNKAKLGKEIIEAIAHYTSGDFDDFTKLSAFISKVDAFITTSSILQKERKRTAPRAEFADDEPEHPDSEDGMPEERMAEAAPKKVAAGTDEWDF
jgi:hypothetical protein